MTVKSSVIIFISLLILSILIHFFPTHMFIIGCIIVGECLYLLPSIVGAFRYHNNLMPLVLINIFAGWSIIGWFVSLIWGFTNGTSKRG